MLKQFMKESDTNVIYVKSHFLNYQILKLMSNAIMFRSKKNLPYF